MPDGILLGIDVGTSSCKAVALSPGGATVGQGLAPTRWRRVPTGAQTGPQDLLDATVAAVRHALAGHTGARVTAVGVASMAETGVLLDGRGRPLAPAIAWHDTRSRPDADALASDVGADAFSTTTGLPAGRVCSASMYRWLRRSLPEAGAGKRWLAVAEWIVHALGGQDVAELSLASRTGLLDVSLGQWWSEALAWAGAPDGLLPPLVAAGAPVGRVSESLPVLEGAVLTVGGHDHLCAAVGAGAVRDGDVFDSCGTAEAFVRAVPPRGAAEIAVAVARGLTAGWHVLPGQHSLLGGVRAGMALQGLLDLLGVGDDERERFDLAAIQVGSVPQGLTVDVANGSATLAGIGPGASPEAAWRAALETVSRHGADVLARIESVAGPTERLVVCGGWARSAAFRAVKESVLGPFVHSPVPEPGARGAALMAGLAAGVYGGVSDFPEVGDRTGCVKEAGA